MNFKKPLQIGQVWMVDGENDPSKWRKGVQEKTRPGLIIGIHGASCNCVPITSSEEAKTYNKIYKSLPNGDILLPTQIKTISREQLISYMYTVDNDILTDVTKQVASLFTDPGNNWYKPVSKRHQVSDNNKPAGRTKTISDNLKRGILKDYTEMPMSKILYKYRNSFITKTDVYQIIMSI